MLRGDGERLCLAHASSFSLAAQYMPEKERTAAYELYGFCRATDQILDVSTNVKEKTEQLNDWQLELTRAWEQDTSSIPILHGFVQTCKEYSIPREWGFRLIEGLRQDLSRTRYETFDELYEYCFSAAAIPGLFMAYVARAPHAALEHAIELGIGMQLTNILRDVREDYEMGRIYLPQHELTQFGCTDETFVNAQQSPAFQKMMQFQVARARGYYMSAEEGIRMLPQGMRMSMHLSSLFYHEILVEIERKNYDVFSGRVFVPDARKKELVRTAEAHAKVLA